MRSNFDGRCLPIRVTNDILSRVAYCLVPSRVNMVMLPTVLTTRSFRKFRIFKKLQNLHIKYVYVCRRMMGIYFIPSPPLRVDWVTLNLFIHFSRGSVALEKVPSSAGSTALDTSSVECSESGQFINYAFVHQLRRELSDIRLINCQLSLSGTWHGSLSVRWRYRSSSSLWYLPFATSIRTAR